MARSRNVAIDWNTEDEADSISSLTVPCNMNKNTEFVEKHQELGESNSYQALQEARTHFEECCCITQGPQMINIRGLQLDQRAHERDVGKDGQ